MVRPSDCEADLEWLIRERYSGAAAFCKATGLGAKELQQFLKGRGDLSVTALEEGLERIGYGLRVRPLPAEAQREKAAKARVA